MGDGSHEDTNAWAAKDWTTRTSATTYGVRWLAKDGKSNWTRFMNHAGGEMLNAMISAETRNPS